MKYCKHFLIVFFLICFSISGYSQNDVEQLFENNKYDKLISILIKKKENSSLSLKEYYLLTKSYGRKKQYSNGWFYTKQMEEECLKQKDTTNLIKSYNLISENLIDLGEILIYIINDNGIGINISKKELNTNKTSLSTQITSDRLKILSKEYKAETDVVIHNLSLFDEKGTQVKLTIPYKIG